MQLFILSLIQNWPGSMPCVVQQAMQPLMRPPLHRPWRSATIPGLLEQLNVNKEYLSHWAHFLLNTQKIYRNSPGGVA